MGFREGPRKLSKRHHRRPERGDSDPRRKKSLPTWQFSRRSHLTQKTKKTPHEGVFCALCVVGKRPPRPSAPCRTPPLKGQKDKVLFKSDNAKGWRCYPQVIVHQHVIICEAQHSHNFIESETNHDKIKLQDRFVRSNDTKRLDCSVLRSLSCVRES